MTKIKSNDWHKAFHDRDLVDCDRASAEERGAYYTIRNLIYRDLGHVVNDDVHLARWCHLKPNRFAKVKTRLIALALLYVSGTSLRSRVTDRVIEERLAKRRKASKSGKLGGQAKAKGSGINPHKGRRRALPHEGASEPHAQSQLFEEPDISGDRYGPSSLELTEMDGQVDRKPEQKPIGSSVDGSAKSLNGHAAPVAIARNSLGQSKSLRKKKKEKTPSESLVIADDDLTADAVDSAFAAYNEAAGNGNDWPRCKALTPKRSKLLAKVLQYPGSGGLAGFKAMLTQASASDWIAGRTARKPPNQSWRASLDYLARVDVFFEVVEGKHDNKSGQLASQGAKPKSSALGAAIKQLAEEGFG